MSTKRRKNEIERMNIDCVEAEVITEQLLHSAKLIKEKDTPGTRKLFEPDTWDLEKPQPVKKTRDERFPLNVNDKQLASLNRVGRQAKVLRDAKLLSLKIKAKGSSAEAREKDVQNFPFECSLKSAQKYREGSNKDIPIDPLRVLKEPNYLYNTLREKAKNRLRSTENGMR